MINIDEAIDLIPKSISNGIQGKIQLLGSTNRSFKLQKAKISYVLRIDDHHTKDLKIDRLKESLVLNNAARAQIAPEVIFEDHKHGILVTLFIKGSPWLKKDFHDPKKIKILAKLLHEIHALPEVGYSFKPKEIAKNYISNIGAHSDYYDFSNKCMKIIADLGCTQDQCCCHNDIHGSNLIQGERLMVLDWEYAFDNSPMFELASISSYHNLNKASNLLLLDEYYGSQSKYLYNQFLTQTRLFDAIYWLWLAVRQANSPNESQINTLQEIRERLL